MYSIDSQIWIYYFDPNASENRNVTQYLEGSEKNGILFKKELLLPAIIPIEVCHSLFKIEKFDKNSLENFIISFISLRNCQFADIDQLIVLDSINLLKTLSDKGVGGRDFLILTTMKKFSVTTLVTHDKNLLRLKILKRIDPVFQPPVIYEIGEEFDEIEFSERVKDQKETHEIQ